jgi:TIR domain
MSTKPAVFISYPRADENVANKLRAAISVASTEVDVLIDHAMMVPGDDYEKEIAQGISRSKWFILLCVGNYIADKDMTWCYTDFRKFLDASVGSISAT